MELRADSGNPQSLVLELEFVPEDEHDADPIAVGEISRDVLAALEKNGYTVQPVYTGQRGGPLFEVILFLTTMATDAWAQKDIILADTSALVTIFGAVIPIAKHLLKAHEKRASRDNTEKSPIKITAEIDGVLISIEAPDMESADAAMKLAKRFQTNHPVVAAKVLPQSKVRVTGHVPKNQPRRRR